MKTVLVTGASSGFGNRVAEKLLDEGYSVYAAARRVEKMADIEAKGAHILRMDVTDNGSVEARVAQVIKEQGRIDVLFNNAGYGSIGPIECVPLEEIKRQYEVNVFGMARLIKAVLPHMRQERSGLIINTASMVGRFSIAVMGWYASTKYAIEGMSDALRMEVKPFGISVVVIEPGVVKTEFDDVAFAALDKLEEPEDYKALVAGFRKFFQKGYEKAPGSESTADAVVRAIKAKRPKTRYATTTDARVLPKLRRWLPDRLFDSMILREFK
ncbi:MAG: SDR family NAD(P)-dependent oxidoreductase [Deltaproteobacteria bacterium]|nr:SDR family NAD(P)-dependent oxidoreductase [Deltaproteobacteria bacterium]